MTLKDKVAIITGGAQGLGYAYAIGFVDEGAKVAIADINVEAANQAAENLEKKGGEVLAIKTDVSDLESVREMARKTAERFGGVDILVNNAAMLGRVAVSRNKSFYELDLDEWDRVMAVNVKGTFLCAREVFPYMKERGGGKIINIASTQFFHPSGGRGRGPRYVHYIASKGAVVGITRALAREMGEYNINVNCIALGSTLSEDPSDQAAIELRKGSIASRAIQRMEYPEDVVGTAIFLASSSSDFITGQIIVVDGGGTMR